MRSKTIRRPRAAMSSIIAVLLVLLISTTTVFGCTGAYVGKEVSTDGSTLVARTEDIDSGHAKEIQIHQREDRGEDGVFTDPRTGATVPQPGIAYKYSIVPDCDVAGDGIYGAVGFNEYGVSITATVTGSGKAAVSGTGGLDPFARGTVIREANIPSIILPKVQTAREGVKYLVSLVEEYGSAEPNIIMIADNEEAWYIEILSGHRYAAVKAPEDKAAVFPNCFMLGYVDIADTENVIASPDLITFAQENGFAVEHEGRFHTALSYGATLSDGNRVRVWGGQNLLGHEVAYDAEVFELFFDPGEDISLKDIMELQRYRYEGTEMDKNLEGNEGVRAIGTEGQAECHIIQIKEDFPKELGGTLWLTMGNAEHTLYLPSYGIIDDTHESYKVNAVQYNADSAFWMFRRIGTMAELDRTNYGSSIRDYWNWYENELIKLQEEADEIILQLYAEGKGDEAASYATVMAIELADNALEKANIIFSELFTHIAKDGSRTANRAFTVPLAKDSIK